MTTTAQVLDALSGVRDPELDESLTDLRFVAGVEVDGSSVEVRLRLPTYFCAPNFTYLMVSDAHAAVRALPGVREVSVRLEDHFASEEINDAVGAGAGFGDAFPGQAHGDPDALRELFQRKAFVARQGRLCDSLLRAGVTAQAAAAMRVADLPGGHDSERCLALRAELGLDTRADAPAFLRPDGGALDAATLPRWLRVARLVRLSLEGNGGLCRSLLQTRYGIEDPEEAAA